VEKKGGGTLTSKEKLKGAEADAGQIRGESVKEIAGNERSTIGLLRFNQPTTRERRNGGPGVKASFHPVKSR